MRYFQFHCERNLLEAHQSSQHDVDQLSLFVILKTLEKMPLAKPQVTLNISLASIWRFQLSIETDFAII